MIYDIMSDTIMIQFLKVQSFDTSTRKTLILGINLYVFQNILEIQLLKKSPYPLC